MLPTPTSPPPPPPLLPLLPLPLPIQQKEVILLPALKDFHLLFSVINV